MCIYIYICTTDARKTFNITQAYNNVGNHGGSKPSSPRASELL